MTARKSINLLPSKQLGEKAADKVLAWALSYGRYIIIGTEIVVLLAFISRFKLDRDLTDLREEIDQKSAIIAANQDFEMEVREIQNRITQIAALKNNQQRIPTLLSYIESLTPFDVYFTSISINTNSISMIVNTQSAQGLNSFINNLKDSSMLRDVSVNTLQQNDMGIINFHITATIVQKNMQKQ